MSNKETKNWWLSAYAGRWVARVQGKIVGQGGTPESAWRSAKAHRSKEKPEISYLYDPSPLQLPAIVEKTAAVAPDQEVYLVGGAVRDTLLGKTSHDFDFVTPRDAIALARRAATVLGADFYVLDQDFDAARVIVASGDAERDVLDFTSFRGADIQDDLKARDFTINAIALNLHDRSTLDPLGGAADLRSRTTRMCSATAMADDPIRILRGVRLAAALDLKIEPGTRKAMRAASSLLPACSKERQRDEVFKILEDSRADASLRALEMLDVIPNMMPELAAMKGVTQSEPHVHDVWEHTLSVIRALAEMMRLLLDGRLIDANGILASLLTLGIGRYREQLREHFSTRLNQDRSPRGLIQLAALYHDAGKPSARSIDEEARIRFHGHERASAEIAAQRASEWNLSNAEASQLKCIVENHMRFFHLASRYETEGELPSGRAIYRFFRDAGSAGPEMVLLGLADLRGTRGHTLTEQAWSKWVDVARRLLENLWERPEESVSPPRLVDGNDLMRELGLEEGPVIGRLLETIREAQAAGEIASREAALRVAKEQMGRP